MSLSETRSFLTQLIQRFDPELDVSEGSRADAELIQPILTRIGLDPIDEDMHTFVRERVRQAYGTTIAMTEVDEFTDLFIDPLRVILEPHARETKLMRLRSSLNNIESLSDAEVDALMANFFTPRINGGYATGVVRAYYAVPQTVNVTQTNVATTKSGLRFQPVRSQGITRDEMALNVDGSQYYFDINYIAAERGDEYNIERGEIRSVAGLTTATQVTNLRRFRNGAPRESNVEYAARVQRGGSSDRALVSIPGIASALEESFPDIRGILTVGFGDPEMQRDVVKGGSLGSIPANDDLGTFYGTGTVVDDSDGDLTSPYLAAAGGSFVSRVGSVGDEISDWYVTLSYSAASVLVAVDARIVEVRSSTEVELDHEIPLTATSIVWMLRKKSLTISDIPGGITLPDTVDGTIEIAGGEVHVGGKDDIYIAGATDAATATILSLTDEVPLARGNDAQTQSSVINNEDIVILNDMSVSAELVQVGMSLVLEEGTDVGSYRIIRVVSISPVQIQVDRNMTGTQGTIAWRIVDDISVELTDPKNIKAEGDDLITAAGNDTVTTSSAFNFLDGDIDIGDVLEVTADPGGGEFEITEVNAVTLVVSPAPDRTLSAAAWRVFRRSEGVQTPVVRVSKLELLDSSGAPNGTEIPYRDPVLVQSRSFQNEGSGFVFDDLVQSGIVAGPFGVSTPVAVGGLTLQWKLMDPDKAWGVVAGGDVGTFTFSGGSKTVAQMVSEINADVTLSSKGIKATSLLHEGSAFLGFVCTRLLRLTGGTALTPLGLFAGIPNNVVRTAPGAPTSFVDLKIRPGYLIEFVDGSNGGRTARVIVSPSDSFVDSPMTIGNGPEGPAQTLGLYDNAVLAPAIERARVSRPSVGSARVYYLTPTSAEYRYASTSFEVDGLIFRPDPENQRQILPALPSTAPIRTGLTGTGIFTDTSTNFLKLNVLPGDLLEVLYRPVRGTTAMAAVGNVAVGGLTLRVKLRTDPYIVINFPFDMPRQDVVNYINEQAGEEIASLDAGVLVLMSDDLLVVDSTSTAVSSVSDPLKLLLASSYTTTHPDARVYIVAAVAESVLTISPETGMASAVPNTAYRIRRYLQRISSTEMNDQIDVSGLYYADVQLVSAAPGDQYNIPAEREMTVSGHVGDGYRLTTSEETTSFSRAERLYAEISRTMLLVGSSDSTEEYVQLSQQNVLVNYDRSQLVDDVQSFMDSRTRRQLCSEPLVRHLFPHYVNLTWNYVGGTAEPAMTRALLEAIDDPDLVLEGLELGDLKDVLSKKGATSVYVTDAESTTGRSAPVFMVVYHTADRVVRATIVKDIVDTVRTQKFLPGNIVLRRTSLGGIR